MNSMQAGSVKVEMQVATTRKVLAETAPGEIALSCKNYGLLTIDVRVRALMTVAPHIAEVSARENLPFSIAVFPRPDRHTSRRPHEMSAKIGTWTVQSQPGTTDIRTEIDAHQSGGWIQNSNAWLAVSVQVDP